MRECGKGRESGPARRHRGRARSPRGVPCRPRRPPSGCRPGARGETRDRTVAHHPGSPDDRLQILHGRDASDRENPKRFTRQGGPRVGGSKPSHVHAVADHVLLRSRQEEAAVRRRHDRRGERRREPQRRSTCACDHHRTIGLRKRAANGAAAKTNLVEYLAEHHVAAGRQAPEQRAQVRQEAGATGRSRRRRECRRRFGAGVPPVSSAMTSTDAHRAASALAQVNALAEIV